MTNQQVRLSYLRAIREAERTLERKIRVNGPGDQATMAARRGLELYKARLTDWDQRHPRTTP